MTKTMILGIDSLDPFVLSEHKAVLPNFARLIRESPTFFSESIFPVDTIPAWATINTGLTPGNHGLLYVYDIFDPTMGDLQKLSIDSVRGRTFWDYLSADGYQCVIVFPQLMYPPWDVNGVMVGMSPLERRLDWISAEITIRACPERAMARHEIPHTLRSLWGGFPGMKHLENWVTLGKSALETEKRIAISLSQNESWDLFFVYFNLLDVIQHRLWRFFDERDPTYPGITPFKETILDYYKLFDGFVGEFISIHPDVSLIVLSDHGHHSRPLQTVNVNEFLRTTGYLASRSNGVRVLSRVRKMILDVATRLNIEHYLIRLVVFNERLTKAGKSIYSSAGSIDQSRSRAFLSNFAGIKSYPFGGIEINRELVSASEYEKTRNALIAALSELRSPNNLPLMKFVKAREDVDPGRFCARIYPDILFLLADSYGVGWELYSDPYGKAHDHSVASGGHNKDAVLLLRNIDKELKEKIPSIINVTPSVLELFGVECKEKHLDGESIFRSAKL
jgi:predicted AlkP superfamily phosphohydrolase/phosphomutase